MCGGAVRNVELSAALEQKSAIVSPVQTETGCFHMTFYVALVFIAFFVLWLLSIALFSGLIPANWLPIEISRLTLPSSVDGLGDAMATLDGLFSAIAIVLGLVAILFQGRELKASTDAQAQQADALIKQIAQQQTSNQLGAYTARLQFLTSEMDYLETKIASMLEKEAELKQKGDKEKLADHWNLIKSTRAKQGRFREQAVEIDQRIQMLLPLK